MLQKLRNVKKEASFVRDPVLSIFVDVVGKAWGRKCNLSGGCFSAFVDCFGCSVQRADALIRIRNLSLRGKVR